VVSVSGHTDVDPDANQEINTDNHLDISAAPPSIDDLLETVRGSLDRLTPDQAHQHVKQGALLIDIRYAALRDRDGTIPGAFIVERNELEWRLDPQCDYKLPEATDHGLEVIVLCNEGYASSLAAVSLQSLGLRRATDVVGGFQAWAAAGLPVTEPQASPACQ
jgi:rhodanese-related sulfurtransferase